MKCFECLCLQCGNAVQIQFPSEAWPQYGETFRHYCKRCKLESDFTRALTRKTAADIKRASEEEAQKLKIMAECEKHRFSCRFLYQSVIITTELGDWCFDYHQTKKTLYHESTYKYNFATGDPAKCHAQFRDRKITSEEIIAYIASHEKWRKEKRGQTTDAPSAPRRE